MHVLTHTPRCCGLCAQSTVFEWKVLGRSITLMLIESVVMFALVLALQRMSADSDPWRTAAKLVHRHWKALLAKLRCSLPSASSGSLLHNLTRTTRTSHEPKSIMSESIIPHAARLEALDVSASGGLWPRNMMMPLKRSCLAGRSMAGSGSSRGSADHRQLPSSDLEMTSGTGAAANGHDLDGKNSGAVEPASEAAVYRLADDADEDADLIVGPEILAADAAAQGACFAVSPSVATAPDGDICHQNPQQLRDPGKWMRFTTSG